MRAITVRPPWSWGISHGGKPIENRGWTTTHRGELAIHAGKNWDLDGEDSPLVRAAWRATGHAGPMFAGHPDIPVGAVVAVATLTDICTVRDSRTDCGCGPWAWRGACHWRLADVRPLAEPVECRGFQQLWTLPDETAARVLAQLPVSSGGDAT